MSALFETRGLEVAYPARRGRPPVRALDGVDLTWERGEVLGIVGESGCGKSTLGRALMGLEPPTGGTVRFDGQPLDAVDRRTLRRRVQMVFQDPYQSLNPRRRIGEQVVEALEIHGIGRRGLDRVTRAVRALEEAGLAPAERYWHRYPRELSGGQRQRALIAAAMVLEPEALVCDEPVSALDVSVRAQVLGVLERLRRERGLGYVFITHDLALAWALCDRVAVMYLGRIVEQGTTEQVLTRPRHPYTRALLDVVPEARAGSGVSRLRRGMLRGELPDPGNVPPGCRFHPRCPIAEARCRTESPEGLRPNGRLVECLLVDAPATADPVRISA
jgi:peptide/nickel transport system ATP-binding protein